MSPVAPFLTRIPTSTVYLTDELRVSPGTPILMGTYCMGRDTRHFKDPDVFTPERWNRQQTDRSKSAAFAVLPFGFGARRKASNKKPLRTSS